MLSTRYLESLFHPVHHRGQGHRDHQVHGGGGEPDLEGQEGLVALDEEAQLANDPKILLLDEPFTGLDPLNTQLFEEILAERRAAGTTVLLSTHQMNKVEELCDRALMINRGHMVLYGSVRDIRRQHSDHAVVVRTATPIQQSATLQRLVVDLTGLPAGFVVPGGAGQEVTAGANGAVRFSVSRAPCRSRSRICFTSNDTFSGSSSKALRNFSSAFGNSLAAA